MSESVTGNALADYQRTAVRDGCADLDAEAVAIAARVLGGASKTVLMEAAIRWTAGEIETARRASARGTESRAFSRPLSEWEKERKERIYVNALRNKKRRAAEKAAEIAEHGRALTPDERMEALHGEFAKAMEDFRQRVRLEVTAELLAIPFAIGDGRTVTWGAATQGEHRERIAWLMKHAGSTFETACRHEVAVRLIEAAKVQCLAEVPTDRVAELQEAA